MTLKARPKPQFKPWQPGETAAGYIARLESQIQHMHDDRLRLDRRIRQQRYALRENWMIVEKRAAHRRAWIRSPLLVSMLRNRKPRPWYRRLAAYVLS